MFLAVAVDGVCAGQIRAVLPAKILDIPEANWHLTLRFLGLLEPAEWVAIAQALQQQCLPGGLWRGTLASAFPPDGPEQHIAIQGGTPPWLAELVQRVDAVLTGLGHAPRDMPFLPHITLQHRPENTEPRPLDISLQCESLTLFESRRNANGVYYTPLREFTLHRLSC